MPVEWQTDLRGLQLFQQHLDWLKRKEKLIVRAEAIPNQSLDRIAMLTQLNGTLVPGPILLNLNGVMNPEDSSVATKLLTFDVAGNQYDDIWEITLLGHPVFSQTMVCQRPRNH